MGVHDPFAADTGDAASAQAVAATNATISRKAVVWSSIAPAQPAGDAKDPANPAYDWKVVDGFVQNAVANGQKPLLTVYGTPGWAEGDDEADRAQRFGDPGSYHPNAAHFGDFMTALAARYSGKFGGLPRVKYFQIWNEPNFGQYLVSKRKADIPLYYVKLLNAGYDAVKSASRSNLVISAGFGPFGFNNFATDVDPQVFMRSIFCLRGSGGKKLREVSNCKVPKPKFDVWAQHPYTFAGTPTTAGQSVDAAALGNMIDIKRTLAYAVKKRNVAPAGKKRLWVTEFAWFSNPPGYMSNGQQVGKPLSTHAAYLSESAYRLWKLGFSAFTWYSLYDLADFPSGLYIGQGAAAEPKPALEAFKFPFYADQSGSRVLVWGLVSRGGRTKVRIEKKSGSKWKRVVDLNTDSQGMFYDRVSGSKGTYRARALSGEKRGIKSYQFKAR